MAEAHGAGDAASAVREALALLDHAGVTENGRVSAWLVLGKGYLAAGDYSQALQYLSLYLNSPRGQFHENRLGCLEAFLAAYNGHQLHVDDDIYDDE
jgi:lipopolysaccharide biosynthesis regulator YciM